MCLCRRLLLAIEVARSLDPACCVADELEERPGTRAGTAVEDRHCFQQPSSAWVALAVATCEVAEQ